MTVLDISRYDYNTFDEECFKANGVTGVILASFKEAEMNVLASRCRRHDIPVLGVYGFIYFGSPFGETRDTLAAIRIAQEYGINRVWLDCETDGLPNGFTDAHAPTPSERINAIHKCVTLIVGSGLSAGIYTGGWWWPGNTNNSTIFSNMPLWHSDYGRNDGTQPPVTTVNYGGWTKVAVHQYTSNLPICGRDRDANYILEEDDLSATDIAYLNKLRKLLPEDEVDGWIERGNIPLIDAYAMEQNKLATHQHLSGTHGDAVVFPEVARDGQP